METIDTIRKIREAEAAARKDIENANRQAAEIVASADIDIARLKGSAAKDASAQAKKLFAEHTKAGKAEAGKVRTRSKKELESIRKKAKARLPLVVSSLAEQVVA
ncbi:MAG: hypothetical protein ABH829_02430 [archaeon]